MSYTVKGFSLISLLVVMSILGILAAIAVPGWDGLVGIRLGAASRRVMSDLRYAQDLSLRVGEIYSVAFSGSGYTISRQGVGVIEDPSYRGNQFVVNLSSDYPGIGIAASFGGSSTIQFDKMGGTSGGGQVVISLGSESVTVFVEDVTGRVSF